MALTRRQIAARLRKARNELGFTQKEVAEALGVHRPTISEIEAGRRAVSTEELYRFAQLYGLPVSALLSEPSPRRTDVERILFRAEAVTAPHTRAAVRRFMERCRAERELEGLLRLRPVPDARPAYRAPPPRSKSQAIDQGERIARQERMRLELGTQPLRNPLALLERQGVRIGTIEGLDEEGPDGIYFETDELGPCVGVNPERDQWTGFRSAFTAAHEYAHWLLRDIQAEEFNFQAKTRNMREVRANVFAAAFLMPREGLVQYCEENGLLIEGRLPDLSPADIVRAMDFFGVSRHALLYRLQNVGLLEPGRAEKLRARAFSPLSVAHALGITFRVRRQFGERLPALAIEGWRRGLLSTGRAADLCGFDITAFREKLRELGVEPPIDEDIDDDEDVLGLAGREGD